MARLFTEDMQSITEAIDQSPKEIGFIVRNNDGTAIGFMNLSLRSDYVPGADHKPVAYVEGIYVRAEYQNQGIGRRMMERAADWAREQGCRELAVRRTDRQCGQRQLSQPGWF